MKYTGTGCTRSAGKFLKVARTSTEMLRGLLKKEEQGRKTMPLQGEGPVGLRQQFYICAGGGKSEIIDLSKVLSDSS